MTTNNIEKTAISLEKVSKVFGKVGEEGEADGDQAPQEGEEAGGGDVVGVVGVAVDEVLVEVDDGRGGEGVEFAGLGGEGGGEEGGDEEADEASSSFLSAAWNLRMQIPCARTLKASASRPRAWVLTMHVAGQGRSPDCPVTVILSRRAAPSAGA